MNEFIKTLIYVGAALVIGVVAFVSRPQSVDAVKSDIPVPKMINKVEDPTTAKRLTIVRFDEEDSRFNNFEVAQVDGLWVIPSHDNYPADAEDQMAAAAHCVINLEILGLASPDRDSSLHEEFGVRDPDREKLKPGDKGVGTRVTMKDKEGKNLVDLIIGNEVTGQPQQRYVRMAGEDAVYLAKLDPDKLSTKFEDWIEKDLLKANAHDIKQIEIKDYSSDVQRVLGPRGIEARVSQEKRSEMTLAYDGENAKWELAKFELFDPKSGEHGEYVDAKLSEDQELNQTVLNDLRNALDDLVIVDVSRKPESMSEGLKVSTDFIKDEESFASLVGRGYIPVSTADGKLEILSKEGETICQMNDGVEYVLRFGAIADTQADGKEESADPKSEDESSASVSRYLFLMARYNEDVIAKPELRELPELPAGADVEEKKEDASSSTEEGDNKNSESPENRPAGETPAGEEKPANQEKPAPADDQTVLDLTANQLSEVSFQEEETASQDDKADKLTEPDETSAKAAQEEKAEPATEEKPEPSSEDKTEPFSEKSTELSSKEEAEPAKEDKVEPANEKKAEPPREKTLDEIITERKIIEFENQRTLDEYNAKVKSAKARVKELNSRFGDWYFEIPDDVYQKIHLSKDQVIKKKEDPAEEGGAKQEAGGFGDLNKLRQALPLNP